MHKAIRGKRTLQLNLAYLGGFFDGEGSVFIGRLKRPSGNPSYRINVSCAGTVKEPIEMYRKLFSKSRQELIFRSKKNPKYKPYWMWMATGHLAAEFLRIILPYLVIKKEQARLALEFYEWRESLGKTGIPRKSSEVQRMEQYRKRIHELKGMSSRND